MNLIFSADGPLEPLARIFDKPEPNVLLIVGTGVSVGATGDARATWKGLLFDGLAQLEAMDPATSLQPDRDIIERSFNRKFNLDDILNRAEFITTEFGGAHDPRFAQWLASSVGTLRARADSRATVDAIAAMERAGALILTTNYDSILTEATGLEPVTWEQPQAILEVFTRKRKGIIHIHGHWQRPSSVILGSSSYKRITEAAIAQTQLKSLWLSQHWLYIGCGSGGLDDPNMGALLQWARSADFGNSALSDYFLSTQATIAGLPDHLAKSSSFVASAYTDHAADLPPLLNSLLPTSRPAPFQELGPGIGRVRPESAAPLDYPFPSWQEYLDGAVPALAADHDVSQKLADHGWALVLDSRSAGKSTLAYRIAARPENRHAPTYYLELTQETVGETDRAHSPHTALTRLARPGALFIIDDCHKRPDLAHALWQQWSERPGGSRLLLLATSIQRQLHLPSALEAEAHRTNPPVAIQRTPEDLGAIAGYVLHRVDPRPRRRRPDFQPSPADLARWQRTFGGEVGAFVVALSQRHGEFLRGDFHLPPEAATIWIRDRYLDHLDERGLANAERLAVFGSDSFELELPPECLPYPSEIDPLLRSGAAAIVSVAGGRYRRYRLESNLGELLLKALGRPVDRQQHMVSAAAMNLAFAATVSSILQRNAPESLDTYWDGLTGRLDQDRAAVIERALAGPLEPIARFLSLAQGLGRTQLVDNLWAELTAKRTRLAPQMLQTPLEQLARFMNIAKTHGQTRLVEDLWSWLEANLPELTLHALDTPLEHLVRFMNVARDHGQVSLVAGLWAGLEAAPELAERLFETPLDHLARFIEVTKMHGQVQLVASLWRELSQKPELLAQQASRASYDAIVSFVIMAKAHRQHELAAALWAALASNPEQLADRVLDTVLDVLARFIDAARDDGQTELARVFWSRLSRNRQALAKRALETPLDVLARFLSVASRHHQARLVASLWEDLAAEPEKLAERASQTRVDYLAVFINVARDQGQARLVADLWARLSADPQELARRAFQTRADFVAAFIGVARDHGQSTLVADLWQALAADPTQLVEAAQDIPLEFVTRFLRVAMEHEQAQLVSAFWAELAARPEQLTERASQTRREHLVQFTSLAREHGQHALTDLWAGLIPEPEPLEPDTTGLN